MSLIGSYKNGNFTVELFADGTKIRRTEEASFIPEFAENIDLKICDRCDMGCAFCHEGSTKDGKLGNILEAKFINTLKPYQELSIGGGNVLEHPDLISFLKKLKEKQVIANITLHQTHFEQNQDAIRMMVDEKLVYGIGVSLVNPTSDFISLIKRYPNAVIHIVNGVLPGYKINALRNHGLKILILGYKNLRRGSDYYKNEELLIQQRQIWLINQFPELFEDFDVVSFDNLAVEQLGIKGLLTEEEWNEFYMGDDGSHTFYIDMVNETFSKSSTSPIAERYKLLNSVVDMFHKIRSRDE